MLAPVEQRRAPTYLADRLAQNLREIRSARGWSQEEQSGVAHDTGWVKNLLGLTRLLRVAQLNGDRFCVGWHRPPKVDDRTKGTTSITTTSNPGANVPPKVPISEGYRRVRMPADGSIAS